MKHVPTILAILLLSLSLGCSSSDSRLARFAEHSTKQQAQQNQSMSKLAQSAGENHRRNVEGVEKSQQEVAMLQQEIREQTDKLDAERRALANQRHRESLLAPVIETFGVLLVAALPLMISVYLLHGLRGQGNDEAVSEVVIRELLASESPLLIRQERQQERLQGTVPEQGPPEEMPF